MNEYLDSFINLEKTPQHFPPSQLKLQRVSRLLRLIGQPEKRLKIIHVAGTRGKGSTCAYAAAILKSAGYKVGLYTSPHLLDVTERIAISGPIASETLARILKEIRPQLEEMRQTSEFGRLTYFEVLTAAALYFFAQEHVDAAILETGLGGRLDATNATEAVVYGITPIGLEHTEVLGDTLGAIAAEKVAVVKGDAPKVVVARQPDEARRVIEEHCRRKNARMFYLGQELGYQRLTQDARSQSFVVHGIRGEYALTSSLLGEHQAANAAMAVGLVELFSDDVTEEAIGRGVAEAVFPGRFEVVSRHPLRILDGAHDAISSAALAASVRDVFPDQKMTLALGISRDKNFKAIAENLAPLAKQVILTRADHPRADEIDPLEAGRLFPGLPVRATTSVAEAMNAVGDDEAVLITGSLYVVGEAKKWWNEHVPVEQ